MRPIKDFTECEQGQRLVDRFGDCELEQMSNSDQAALVVILAGYIYSWLGNCPTSDRNAGRLPLYNPEYGSESATTVFMPEQFDCTSEDVWEALQLLNGIAIDDAMNVINFLMQP